MEENQFEEESSSIEEQVCSESAKTVVVEDIKDGVNNEEEANEKEEGIFGFSFMGGSVHDEPISTSFSSTSQHE